MTLPVGSGPGCPYTSHWNKIIENGGDVCDATDALWPITLIKTASSGRLAGASCRDICGEKKRARTSDEPSRNWESNGSRHKVRRPKGASSRATTLATAASRRECAWGEPTR